MGYVYLITNGDAYKIGIASNVSARLATLQTSSHKRLELVRSVESSDAKGMEAAIHAMFSHRRLIGEWFDLRDFEVAQVISEMSVKVSDIAPVALGPKSQLAQLFSGVHRILGNVTVNATKQGERVYLRLRSWTRESGYRYHGYLGAIEPRRKTYAGSPTRRSGAKAVV